MVFSALTLSVSIVLKQSHDIIHLRQQANIRSVRLRELTKLRLRFFIVRKTFSFFENNFKYVIFAYLLEFDKFLISGLLRMLRNILLNEQVFEINA